MVNPKVLPAVLATLSIASAFAAPADAEDSSAGSRVRLQAQLGHDRVPLFAVAFSPDGGLVATGGEDGLVVLWDVETGRQVRTFEEKGGSGIGVVAFSPDGLRVFTADGAVAHLWDTRTGKQLQRFVHGGVAALSPEGGTVITAGGDDNLAHLWDATTARRLAQLEGHRSSVGAVAVSSDGRRVLTGGGAGDASVRLWDAESGRQLLKLEGHEHDVVSVAFAPDGSMALTAEENGATLLWDLGKDQEPRSVGDESGSRGQSFSRDGALLMRSDDGYQVVLRDAATGRVLHRFGEPGEDPPTAMALSRDGKHLLLGLEGTSKLLEIETGEEVQRFKGQARTLRSAAFLSDGRRLVATDDDYVVHVWDGPTGREARRFTAGSSYDMAVSVDGRRVVTGHEGGARLWDLETGLELRSSIGGHDESVWAVAISGDGRRVATASSWTAFLWDTATGIRLQRFVGHDDDILNLVLSSDGRYLLTRSSDGTARLWDTETGEERQRFEPHGKGEDLASEILAFSPDGAQVLTAASNDSSSYLWNVGTGKKVQAFAGTLATLSADGRKVLHVFFSEDLEHEYVVLSDAETGAELRRFEGHEAEVTAVGFSPDGRWVLTAGFDRTTRIWEAESGRELAQLSSFADGTWVVADSVGHFDASNAGDIGGLHFVSGLEPIALSQLKERYYEPGLLAKVLGFNDEPLREVEVFNERGVELFPEVTVTQVPSSDDRTLRLRLENRGGGIGRVAVFVNGKEHIEDARPPGADARAATLDIAVDLAGSPLMIPGAANRVEFVAYNAAGYLASPVTPVDEKTAGARGGRTTPVAASVAQDPPALWAVVAGVSDYLGEKIDLKYASSDAEAFASALGIAAEGGSYTEVKIRRLTDGGTPATRANADAAFEWLRQARPTDVLVVYLAGHGITWGGVEGDYYYLLQEAPDVTNDALKDPTLRGQRAISSRELIDKIKLVPALKQVLVLDTCASGQAITELNKGRAVSSSQARAMDKVKDRTGMFVLAGSAADKVSYEATEYGQGLLTYSLLEGMQGAALGDNDLVDVQVLLAYSQSRVPDLAGEVETGGVQRPQVSIPQGGTFFLGEMSAAERGRIVLAQKRPLVLRASFQSQSVGRDKHKLGDAVNEALREVAARGRTAPLVFVPVSEMASAYRLVGSYGVAAGAVSLKVFVSRGETDIGAFEVAGPVSAPAELAARVVAEAQRVIAQQDGG